MEAKICEPWLVGGYENDGQLALPVLKTLEIFHLPGQSNFFAAGNIYAPKLQALSYTGFQNNLEIKAPNLTRLSRFYRQLRTSRF